MDIFTGLGLAAPAGLNAYIPLLTLGIVARFTDLVTLEAPFDLLASDAGLITLAFLLLIELFADAVPGLDHVNDVIQTGIRPAAGAVVMMASNGEIVDAHPAILALLGIVLAGGVHAAKASGRPFVTAGTGGVGNPIVSTMENVAAVVLSILAIVAPLVVLVVLLIALVLFTRWLIRKLRARPA